MALRDFALLFAICLVWGLNLVVTRWVVADMGVPPMFFAALRFLGVAVLLIPFLRPVPPNLGLLALVSLMIGSVHFALLFIGLQNAEASSIAVVGQLGVPISTLLSMMFLGETIGWRRALGILLAFAGVMIIALDPSSFTVSFGLLFIVGSAFVGSVGGIVMKQMPKMSALQLQAWVGLFSFAPLFAVSAFAETGQINAVVSGGWQVAAASLFAIVGVSIFGHSAFYTLLKRYDVSLLSPLTLMTPVWGVAFGVVLLSEPLTLRLLIGGLISLSGVFVIAIRRNTQMPEAALGKTLGSDVS